MHISTHLDAGCKADLARDQSHAKAEVIDAAMRIIDGQRAIRAEHVRLALVARKVRSTTRWAAMSNGAQTSSCQRRQPGGGYFIHVDPLMSPLTAGRMQAVYDRVRSHGRAEVLRTWGASIAVLKVEFSTCVLRAPAAKCGAL